MITLSQEEKELILNFYFRCGSEEEINRGRDLIAADSRAARLYSSLEETLCRLDHVKYEPCPDNLAELTLAKLRMAAQNQSEPSGGTIKIDDLLQKEQAKQTEPATQKTQTRTFWNNFSEVAAVAAVILIAMSVIFPTTSHMRYKALQARCAAGLRSIFNGITSYVEDNDDYLPSVAAAGTPWLNLREDGRKPESNSRNLYMLVKNAYVEPKHFVCPGRKSSLPLDLELDELKKLDDFPKWENVNFSFRLICDKAKEKHPPAQTVLLADLNPVFEQIFQQTGLRPESVVIKVDEGMLKVQSRNHAGKGQNVLFRDGSVRFIKTRHVFDDDIYTIRNAMEYSGKETPCDEKDIFLAP